MGQHFEVGQQAICGNVGGTGCATLRLLVMLRCLIFVPVPVPPPVSALLLPGPLLHARVAAASDAAAAAVVDATFFGGGGGAATNKIGSFASGSLAGALKFSAWPSTTLLLLLLLLFL